MSLAEQTPELSRSLAHQRSTDIGAMTMMLYSMPRPVEEVDAIAVLPGLGEYWRAADAVQTWNTSKQARFMLIAGVNRKEASWTEPSLENLSKPPINLKRERFEGVHAQPDALHTRHQAEWLADKVEELDVQSMALYVSPYHLLRGYCTVLKTFQKHNTPFIPIIPMPASVSPEAIVPDTGNNAWESVQGEVERIAVYQERGDVATREELQEHIGRMWQHPMLGVRDLSR